MMNNKKPIYLFTLLVIGIFTIISCNKKDDCTEQTWYQDSDGDGFGNQSNSQQSCSQPTGYVKDSTDFDDNNASSYPSAPEICNDGIDNDGDGFTDCDDNDCNSDPACVVEICDDGIDNDGDGFTDCDDSDCTGFPGC